VSIAKRPSKITLPAVNKGWDNLLDFLVEQFPLIEKNIWHERFQAKKIHWLSGEAANHDSPFLPSKVLCYYREVKQEPIIPFAESVVFQNQEFLIADKPHFLPVTPGGVYVNECLLERLRDKYQLEHLVPCHRLDKETAGLVMFSLNPETRADYCQLFANQKISKTYHAIAALNNKTVEVEQNWTVNNRLVRSEPRFLMHAVEGEINARSKIKLIEKNDSLGLFELSPITGKTHQLRLHMMAIGLPILNDKFYPKLQEKSVNGTYRNPLQLLAKQLNFIDPISQKVCQFTSSQDLYFD
jgi:tRNA pseudouridine32 synthase / 23S rRNA pseudouridine746 synthase